jgi:hypothetical protein
MSEVVVLTPSNQDRYDSDGNPVAGGDPVTLHPLEIAPGNTLLTYGIGGDLDDVAFTVFFELGTPIVDDDELEVRGKHCRARVGLWDSTGLGGLAVLARSTTGGLSGG